MKPIIIKMEEISKYKELYYMEPRILMKIILSSIVIILVLAGIIFNYLNVDKYMYVDALINGTASEVVYLYVELTEDEAEKIMKDTDVRICFAEKGISNKKEHNARVVQRLDINNSAKLHLTKKTKYIYLRVDKDDCDEINSYHSGTEGQLKIIYGKESVMKYLIDKMIRKE